MAQDTTPTPGGATTPPATPAPAENPTPGYFNQAQLEDITTAEDVLAAITDERAPLLTKRRIDQAYRDGLALLIKQARNKISNTAEAGSDSEDATMLTTGAARTLVVALQGIQSAAKQLKKMLAEDDDPATNFSTEGYLIGQRLNKNRATLLQNAEALIAKAGTDDLPGYDAAEIALVQTALQEYRDDKSSQQKAGELSEQELQTRDGLIRKINARRAAIQHAADALWTYTEKTNRPTRKAFKLPLSRPLNA
jgi:isocitrate lyase